MAPGSNPPVRVHCCCSKCEKSSYRDQFGNLVIGKLVAPQTRRDHYKKDEKETKGSDKNDNVTASGPYSSAQHLSVHQQAPEQPTATPSITPASSEDEVKSSIESIRQFYPMTGERTATVGELKRTVSLVFYLFAGWLHVVTGVSRESTGKALKAVVAMIILAFRLGCLLAGQNFDSVAIPLSLPVDVRTAISELSIEPKLDRSVCCPKCFTQYPAENIPKTCPYRETPRSWECGASLWTTVVTRAGPTTVPKRLYTTQSFHSWLEYFLSRPGIEDLIDQSYHHQPNHAWMKSVWDSPAWDSLGPYARTPGNLTFSYYIDWFNPLGNKIAGKKISCGAIMLFCLNLPYELQHRPENTFFAGITPPPKEPTVTTITALSDPIIDQLEEAYTGISVRTSRFPQGVIRRAAVLPGIGDILAIRKAFGFAGHASDKHFCSWCKLPLDDIDSLAMHQWEYRTAEETYDAAARWRDAKTKTARTAIFGEYGVRWSSMHRLSYRHPIHHTVLGVMHNWIEGVLQHHVRVKWGLGIPSSKEKSGISTSQQARKKARKDSAMAVDDPLQTPRAAPRPLRSEVSLLCMDFDIVLDDVVEAGTETESDTDVSESEESATAHDPQPEGNASSPCIFGPEEISQIQACLANASVPSWLERPPVNLGEPSHGNLKANHWLVLATVFLPMVIPELWLEPSHQELLDNFADLITCTNIVCAYATSANLADLYTKHYLQYRESSRKLFPNVTTRPNHHYAMHNGDLLKYWGPLIRLSEFQGETHNGNLQKIKTNGHLRDLDFTMLRQICRRGRLLGLLGRYINSFDLGSSVENGSLTTRSNTSLLGTVLKNFADDLGASFPTSSHPSSTATKLSTIKNDDLTLSDDHYNQILEHVNQRRGGKPLLRHFSHLPHPLNSTVLSPYAVPLRSIEINTRTYSPYSSHPGNSAIIYSEESTNKSMLGIIHSMWSLEIDQQQEVFLMVQIPVALQDEDQRKNPYARYPGLFTTLVYDQFHSTHIVVRPHQVQAHVAFYKRPAGTFRISSGVIIFVNSLHRFRS